MNFSHRGSYISFNSAVSSCVILIMQHVLQTLKAEHPAITTAFYRQDNAGCYHCANTIVACPLIGKSTGIHVSRLDFSDPQGGKGPADRLAATCKSHIRIYINEGHNVTKAEEMQEALLSHGGVSGVRVAVLHTVPEIIQEQKFPGISKLHNFEFGDGAGVRHWFRKAFCGRQKYRSVLILFLTIILES